MSRNLNELEQAKNLHHRRYFLNRMSTSLGSLGLASLLGQEALARRSNQEAVGGLKNLPHHKPKAKRVIYLFQSGGPAQMDLYDYKPQLAERFGEEVPKSVYPDDRKTTMSNAQASFPVAPSIFKFSQHGKGGNWLPETLPKLSEVSDDLCIINSFHTDAINHDPAATLMQSGSQIPGRPSIGSWLGYGLGNMNANLPAFVAMSSRGTGKPGGQPLYDRLWGSGFLPSRFQGVKFRNQGDPVLDINNPSGVDTETRRAMLDSLKELNRIQLNATGNPDIETRISQYELAYRMQMSIPQLLDMSDEPKHVLDMYGPDALKPGTYAYNCLIARRLPKAVFALFNFSIRAGIIMVTFRAPCVANAVIRMLRRLP